MLYVHQLDPNHGKNGAYRRSATSWHSAIDRLGREINYITSNEVGVAAVAIARVYDPASREPSCRIVNGERVAFDESDQPYPACGLTVFGRSKFDRPTLKAFANCAFFGAAAVVAAVTADVAAAVAAELQECRR